MSKKILMVSMSIVMTMLMFACKKDEAVVAAPQADFEVVGDFIVGHQLQFKNSSKDATKYSWDFGDGATSSDQNPTHTYSITGYKTVTLKAINDGGESTKKRYITVVAANNTPVVGAPIAAFTVSTANRTSTFTNTSTGATSYLWDFGEDRKSVV